jgi:hypothetical protein
MKQKRTKILKEIPKPKKTKLFKKLPKLDTKTKSRINAIGQSHVLPGMNWTKLETIFKKYNVVNDETLIQNMESIEKEIEGEIKC